MVVGMSAATMPTFTVTDLAIHGVRLIGANSSAFSQLLQQRVDPQSLTALSPILPYGVIVANDSQLAIGAVTVIYSLKNAAGMPITHRRTLRAWNNQRSRMLLPGEYAFFVPFGGLSAKLRSGPTKMLTTGTFSWPERSLYASQTDITISIDVAVFENGVAVGPDKGNTVDRINAFVAADRDIGTAILARSGDTLKTYLSGLASNGSGKDPFVDPYDYQIEARATLFYNQLLQSGEAPVILAVNTLLQSIQQLPVVKRSIP